MKTCVLDEWEKIDFLKDKELDDYLLTLDEDEKAKEIEIYGKRCSVELLKDHMNNFLNFYFFIKDYSPCDFKYIGTKPYVSQRVIVQHVQLWNELHKCNKIKKLRVFIL